LPALSHYAGHPSWRRADIADFTGVRLPIFTPSSSEPENDGAPAATAIERYPATVKELKGHLPCHLLCASVSSGRPPVLARCTRLEVWTCARYYTRAIWLGLSQPHMVQDVDLSKVSTVAIAEVTRPVNNARVSLHGTAAAPAGIGNCAAAAAIGEAGVGAEPCPARCLPRIPRRAADGAECPVRAHRVDFLPDCDIGE
jgi:hypothetical protein